MRVQKLVFVFGLLAGCAGGPRAFESSPPPIHYGNVTVSSGDGCWSVDLQAGATPYAVPLDESDTQTLGFALQRTCPSPADQYSEVAVTFVPSRAIPQDVAYQLTGCGRQKAMGLAEGSNPPLRKISDVVLHVPNNIDHHICFIHVVEMRIPAIN